AGDIKRLAHHHAGGEQAAGAFAVRRDEALFRKLTPGRRSDTQDTRSRGRQPKSDSRHVHLPLFRQSLAASNSRLPPSVAQRAAALYSREKLTEPLPSRDHSTRPVRSFRKEAPEDKPNPPPSRRSAL